MKKILNFTVLTTFILFLISSCKKEKEVVIPYTKTENVASTSIDDVSVLGQIKAMGFADTSIKDLGEFYLVENDIIFNKAGDYSNARIEQHCTYGLITYEKQSPISISIDASMPIGGSDDWRNEIGYAIGDYNLITNSQIRLTNSYNSSSNITVLSDFGQLPDNVLAAAEFPSNGNPGYRIRVNLDFYSNMNMSSSQKRYTMNHEIGHCLGLRHTNWWNTGETEGSIGANQIPNTPNADASSVMNGGTALNSWAGFSFYDTEALRTIYPKNPYTNGAKPLYRYWSSSKTDHFYTRYHSIAINYNYEGVECYIFDTPVTGTVPLYRYYHPTAFNHYYKTSSGTPAGYNYEGVEGYVYSTQVSGTVPIYSYYNSQVVDHYYTKTLGTYPGSVYEGVAWYAFP